MSVLDEFCPEFGESLDMLEAESASGGLLDGKTLALVRFALSLRDCDAEEVRGRFRDALEAGATVADTAHVIRLAVTGSAVAEARRAEEAIGDWTEVVTAGFRGCSCTRRETSRPCRTCTRYCLYRHNPFDMSCSTG